MASKKSKGGDRNIGGNTKMGDIHTAAKSTMEACDYSQGYPMRPGALQNTNFSGKSRNAGGKS